MPLWPALNGSRALYLKQAEIKAQTDAAAAQANAAGTLAEAVRIEGEAQAGDIAAKDSAEAEAMLKKADAFGQYGDAAVLQMLVEILPQVVADTRGPQASSAFSMGFPVDGSEAGPLPRGA